jgi:thymidine kinase
MSLEIVLGPMFSGKSSYALSYVRRQRAIGRNVLVIKPNLDRRYTFNDELVTHNKETIPCTVWDVENPLCMFLDLDYDCFVIEEAQFFNHLEHFCHDLLFREKKHLLVVGLDGDFNQKKFGEVLDIIPIATSITKLTSLCSVCCDGTAAPYTKRLQTKSVSQIDVGGAEKYVAVCLSHL